MYSKTLYPEGLRHRFVFAAAGLTLLLASFPSFCAESWTLPLFTPDPATVYDAAQKFAPPRNTDVYYVEYQATVSIDSAGHLTNRRRVVARVLTDAGVKQVPNLTEAWMSWRQNKPVMRARVITADKQAHVLDPATIIESGMPGVNDMYGDVKLLQAPLPAVATGAVIEYEVETVDRESVMPGARFENYAAASLFPVHHLSVLVQTKSPIHAEARGFDSIKRTETGPGEVRFEAWDMRKHENEAMLPPDAPAGPEIVVTTAPSWQSVARFYAGLTEPLLATAATPPAAPADRNAIIRTALADIQKSVRYTGMELGMGAYAPRTPAETLKRGYGDCKDKATLLISRLRAAGISAQYALLKPYPFPDVLPGMPGLEAFNHVIVYLPGEHPQWIDPTAEFVPATRLPIVDQGRSALIVDPQTTGLTRTPESEPAQNHVEVEQTIYLQPQGKAKFLVRNIFTGGAEDFTRGSFSVLLASPSQRAKLETSLRQNLRVDKITMLESDPPLNLDNPFELRFGGEGLASSETRGDRATAFVTLDSEILGQLPQLAAAEKAQKKEEANKDEEDAKPVRTKDYYLLQRFTAENRTIVVPPPGFRVKQIPEVSDLSIAGAKLERTAALRPDNSVVITSRYSLTKSRFPVAAAEKTADELKELAKLTPLRIEFVDQAQQLFTQGKDKEAITLARERVSAAPKVSAALIHLASTLSAAGANLDAIDTCLRATALDGNSYEAYVELADLYARDEAGRLHRPGMQRRKAIEAMQRAIELKPKEKSLQLKLAELYSFNDKGMFLGKGADLAQAVSTLQKLEADPDKGANSNPLASALIANRQFDDVKKLYAKDPTRVGISFRLSAIAATETVEAATAAFDASGARESREKAFTDAARSLIQLREYPAAAGLLREAFKENETGGQADADLLAHTNPRAQAKFSDSPPVALTQKLIYALLDMDNETAWRQLYVPEWRDLNYRAERNRVWNSIAAYHQLAKIAMGWEGASDLAVSNGVFVSDGSDAVGYRVRMADPSNNGAMKTIAWVVKRGSAFQVLGLNIDWAPLGAEALTAAKRGDLKAARQWLDWMREEEPHESATDPLGAVAFTRIWTPEISGETDVSPNAVLAAAASLAARGAHYEDALVVLRDLQKQTAPGALRDGIDSAVLESLLRHHRPAEAVPEAESLWRKFPRSDSAVYNLALAMSAAGQDAEAFLTARLAADPGSAAVLRAQARVRESKSNFDGAVEALRKLSQTSKVTPQDWNSLAWTSLYSSETGAAAVEAANTANRLTQNRNAGIQHTLGCVKAATGDTSGARKALFQYLDSAGEMDDAGRVLLGMIQEQLGLSDTARATYSKIKSVDPDPLMTNYALAQKRLAAMGPAKQASTGQVASR